MGSAAETDVWRWWGAMEKRISLKGLADYMTAGHARQRKLLRQYKYPDEDEAKAKRLYYREARDGVVSLHRANRDSSWLLKRAASIDADAAAATKDRTRVRLESNARALRAYGRHFGLRRFEVLKPVKLGLRYGDVLVSVFPDLVVRENGHQKVVKLEFRADEPPGAVVKILSQALFEAAQQAGLAVPSSGVLLFDVRRGHEHRGARLGARMRAEIVAACETISAVWDTI